MKGIHRLSWVFGMLEKKYDIKYHLWSVGPASIVFAWGRKGTTKPTDMELPYQPVSTKETAR